MGKKLDPIQLVGLTLETRDPFSICFLNHYSKFQSNTQSDPTKDENVEINFTATCKLFVPSYYKYGRKLNPTGFENNFTNSTKIM